LKRERHPFFIGLDVVACTGENYSEPMRTRRTLIVLVVAAAIVGAYFGGRASESRATPTSLTTLTTLHVGSTFTVHTNWTKETFNPVSVTFVSLDTGWALGTAPCAKTGTCLALRETTDAGRTWTAKPLSTALLSAADRVVNGRLAAQYYDQLNVRFANTQDGWIYGSLPGPTPPAGVDFIEPVQYMWSTHDGGLVWRKQSFAWLGKYGSLFDVEAANGTVYVMGDNKTFHVTVESSPVGADNWHVSNAEQLGLPAGGAQPSGSIVLNGSSGWLVVGNDRGTSGAARLSSNGKWVPWTPPCSLVGNSFAAPAASTSSTLVAVCMMGGFAEGLSPQAPHGATVGSSWLYVSHDGGRTFAAGPELGLLKNDYGYGVLASPRPGVILISRPFANAEELMASFDGGVSWNVFYRGTLFYLGFTSASQGVGLVQSPKGPDGVNTLIMTFDGGHHWAPVTF
jgi:hypothetical protein